MKVVSYKTIFAKTPGELDQFLKLEISEGFEPYGNPYVKEGRIEKLEGDSFFCQAMIKPHTSQPSSTPGFKS
jgi:hypothetical protein